MVIGATMLLRCGGRRALFHMRPGVSMLRFSMPVSTSAALKCAPVNRKMKVNEQFWDKNKRMERPMSPHVTIYKFELPALMSISHRFTGLALSGVTVLLGVSALGAPDNLSHYLEILKTWNLPLWFLLPAKSILVWPVAYHTANGLRHLFWDMGIGLHQMSNVFKSGYAVLISSFVLTFGIVGYLSM